MIERIVIRDVATHGYEGVTFDNLQLANFIYGGNNCDKTSLSRTLACTEPEKDYLNCEIHLTTKLTQTLEDGGQATVPNLKINILQNYSLAAAWKWHESEGISTADESMSKYAWKRSLMY